VKENRDSGWTRLRKLNDKHRAFIEFVVLGLDVADAASRAGFRRAAGFKLIKSELITTEIELKRADLREIQKRREIWHEAERLNAGMDADQRDADRRTNAVKLADKALTEAGADASKIVTELVRVGLSDPREIFDANNNLLDVKAWPDHVAAAVASIEIEERTRGGGDNVEHYLVKKVKYWPKVEALGKLLLHLGIAAPKKGGGSGKPALHIHMHEGMAPLPSAVRAGALTIDMQEVARGADD
jgi:hypothetical protein